MLRDRACVAGGQRFGHARGSRLGRARARLANANRLLDWQPGVGVGRMDFRWVRVRRLLNDLHRGKADDAVA